jgi:hypothetical protein
MIEDVTPDDFRLRQYRPYIMGEETNWNTSMYTPFQSVNFGLYGNWDDYDDLAAISYQKATRQFLRKVAVGNHMPVHPGQIPRDTTVPFLDKQTPFYQVYGSDTGNRVNNGATTINKQQNNLYKRLYAT